MLVAKLSTGALAVSARCGTAGSHRNPWNTAQDAAGSSAGPRGGDRGRAGRFFDRYRHGWVHHRTFHAKRRHRVAADVLGRVSRHGCMSLVWTQDTPSDPCAARRRTARWCSMPSMDPMPGTNHGAGRVLQLGCHHGRRGAAGGIPVVGGGEPRPRRGAACRAGRLGVGPSCPSSCPTFRSRGSTSLRYVETSAAVRRRDPEWSAGPGRDGGRAEPSARRDPAAPGSPPATDFVQGNRPPHAGDGADARRDGRSRLSSSGATSD